MKSGYKCCSGHELEQIFESRGFGSENLYCPVCQAEAVKALNDPRTVVSVIVTPQRSVVGSWQYGQE